MASQTPREDLDPIAAGPLRVASAPVSFGVDGSRASAWTPDPESVLDWIAAIGFEGTELGPMGYLGDGWAVRARLIHRNLALVGAFIDQRFSSADWRTADRRELQDLIALLRDAVTGEKRPCVVLSESLDNPVRRAYAGRVRMHPELWLSKPAWATLVDNVHRAAEQCRAAGFEAVFHPHAGTFVETADEIARFFERADPALIGLCLDTGHFLFGGADPIRSVVDYRAVLRHVHIKDCQPDVVVAVAMAGGDFTEAVRRGVFPPLGQGAVDFASFLDRLRQVGYEGWLVVEQDQVLDRSRTAESLLAGQRSNREYLRRLGV